MSQEGRGKGMPGRGNLRGNGWEVGSMQGGILSLHPIMPGVRLSPRWAANQGLLTD